MTSLRPSPRKGKAGAPVVEPVYLLDGNVLYSVMGHRQITDAYLAALARHHGGKLASFDKGLLVLHSDVAVGLDV